MNIKTTQKQLYRKNLHRATDTKPRQSQQAEKALRESEEIFSKAFRAIPEAVSLATLKNGVFLEVNDSFISLNGYTREEVIGHTAKELNIWVNPDDHYRIKQLMEKHGHFENEEFSLRRKSGETRTVLLSADVINLGGKPCILTVGNDITERKQMEKALVDEATRRRILIEQSRDGIVILDQNGKVYEVNQRFADMLGYSLEEARQLYVFDWEFLYPRERTIEMLRTVDEAGDHFETKHRCKDGTTYDVEISTNGAMFAGQKLIFCVCRDITERKQMEKTLKESEEKISKAFRAIPEAVSIATLKDGVFLEVNDSFISLNGYTREELIGHTAKELNIWVNPGDRYRIKQLMEKHAHFKNEEFSLRRKSGETRTVLLSADVINFGGKPCILTVGNDITERKQAEEKLKSVMASLEHSSARLRATNKELESFSYSVSHDLRAPLRSIAGFSQALLEDYTDKLNAKGQDYLTRIRNASQRMGELIDGMLKLSRLTRSEMRQEKVDLSGLAGEIAARLRETSPDRRVEFIIKSGLSVEGDPEMLRILLENLLGNAMKFTKNTELARIEFGSINNNGAQKAFYIKDNGAGFDMKYIDKLFGAFQRLHDAAEYPGTGIGLATVQRIINRHGGSIRAEGEVGKGATFYFNFNEGV